MPRKPKRLEPEPETHVEEEFDNYILWTDEIRTLVHQGKRVLVPGLNRGAAQFLAMRCSDEHFEVTFVEVVETRECFKMRPPEKKNGPFIADMRILHSGFLFEGKKV